MSDVVLKHSGIRLTFHRRGPASPEVTAVAKKARTGRKPATVGAEDMQMKKALFSANLTWLMKNQKKGRDIFIQLLEYRASIDGADADPRLIDMLKKWHTLSPREQRKANLDSLCLEYGISPPEAFGWYAEESLKHSKNLVTAMLAASSGEIMQASIAKATDVAEGTQERKMVLQAMGVLQNGNRFAVQNNLIAAPQPDAPKTPALGAATGDRPVTHEEGQRLAQSVLRDRFKGLSPAPLVREIPETVDAECIPVKSSTKA